MDNIEDQDAEGIDKHDQARIDQLKNQSKFRAKYKKEIIANEAVQKYLEGFYPSSVETFIDFYCHRKVSWKEYGASWRKSKEKEEEQWIIAAFEHLGYIQQKKLFDLQCLWRADQIKLPSIEISWDFKMWERQNILACSFLEPITETEIELYQNYLLQENRNEEEFRYGGWQDYEEIKETQKNGEDDDLDDLPEWYQFHNSRTGKGILLQLPNLRGEKENFYTHLWHYNNTETQDKPTTPVTKMEDRPLLDYYDDNITKWFVETFENKEVQKWYKDYSYGHKYDDAYETVDENVRFLLSTGETIAIEENEDWVKALEKTVTNYKAAKLSEALWEAWEQYQMTLQSGLGFSIEDNNFESIRNVFAEQILAGRKLNGEPEDFNF